MGTGTVESDAAGLGIKNTRSSTTGSSGSMRDDQGWSLAVTKALCDLDAIKSRRESTEAELPVRAKRLAEAAAELRSKEAALLRKLRMLVAG